MITGKCDWGRMGGSGSGNRWRYGGKSTTDDYATLDVRRWAREGAWKDGQSPVHIVRTPCHLGGSRPWFICPAGGCGRRVAILYLDGGTFACRHCCQLAYVSSRKDASDRAFRRADKLRARLGWVPGIAYGHGGKPKWMRWRTFERLVAKHDDLVKRCAHEMRLKFGLFRRGIPK